MTKPTISNNMLEFRITLSAMPFVQVDDFVTVINLLTFLGDVFCLNLLIMYFVRSKGFKSYLENPISEVFSIIFLVIHRIIRVFALIIINRVY